MRVLVVWALVGRLLRLFSFAFVPPLVFALFEGHWPSVAEFGGAFAGTFGFSYLFSAIHKEEMDYLHRAEALAVVALTWLSIALFGAIPYMFAGLDFFDSFFESMSGFTTTGATILTDFSQDHWGRAFFLWRSMTQWFGGLGVIALFVLVLPKLGVAGRQLFFAEASDAPGEAVNPQIRHSASRLWILYTCLTLLLIGLLIATDMDAYDAVCNSLTTLSAGGFSPNPSSIMGYNNPTAEWILTIFMVLSGMSYPLIYVSLTRRPYELLRDEEFRFYFLVILIGTAVVATILWINTPLDTEDSVRTAAFQAASLISSTGFASADFNLWSDAAKVMLVLLMIVGGCAGSAAGGPKAIRHLLVLKHVMREFKRTLHPRAVLALKYKGRAVSDNIMRTIFTLVVIYVGVYFMLGVVLGLFGHDMVTSFSAALAIVGNVGPAFNEAGPMGNFAFFGDPEKLLMTLGMWIGRLEILTVVALLHWHVLRDLRWRRFRPHGRKRKTPA